MDQVLLHVSPPDDNIDTDEDAPPPYSPEQPLLPPTNGAAHSTDNTYISDICHLDLPVDPPQYSPPEASEPSGYSNEGTVLPSTNRPEVDIQEVMISPPPYEPDQPPPYSK